MKIFELHFNPGLREEQAFDSFIYDPENVYEKKLGTLCLLGEIQNALPESKGFLNKLAQVIKKNYYTFSAKTSEKALSQSLKTANNFLSEEVKKDNVGWLGNLNLAVLSLDKSGLVFSKTGRLKILLIRGGTVNDIGRNLNLQEIEPYPLKVFFNVVSGKLIADDVILVLTEEVFKFFSQEGLIGKIKNLSQNNKEINEKILKEMLPSSLFSKTKGSKVSGLCLFIVNKEEPKQIGLRTGFSAKKSPAQRISFQKKKKHFFEQVFYFLAGLLFKAREIKLFHFPATAGGKFKFNFCRWKKSKKSLKRKSVEKIKEAAKKNHRPLVNLIEVRNKKTILLKLKRYKEKLNVSKLKRILLLMLVLIFFLFLGFLIFRKAGQKNENDIKKTLIEIKKEINRADNFLTFQDKEKANLLLQESWRKISLLSGEKSSLKADISSLKKSIEARLNKLNNLEIIEKPELVEKTASDLFPALPSPSLQSPSFSFNFDLSSLYLSNLYFLDKRSCEIVKYPYLTGRRQWGLPQRWMKDKSHCSNPKSMTIDNSIWILNQDNSVSRYYKGFYKETIIFKIFPFLTNVSEIKTSADTPYLYLLEPSQKRIIIADKTGKIVRQFQSGKFDNLKNLAFSKDGKIIYVLNGLKVYQIKL
jgi:hypothetical protein